MLAALRRQEHRQRPAAMAFEALQRAHIERIDIRPLLPVDLDVDEQIVHDLRGRLVLEALMRHDVAPVAGRIADGEQHRFACLLRILERLCPPGPPVDRVILVLKQIRAGLFSEMIPFGVLELRSVLHTLSLRSAGLIDRFT